MAVKKLKHGLVKRREQRALGVFIDGVGLDRATRRLNRKVDMGNLLRGVTSGTPPRVARYYTLIPNEDDSRQRAYLDAVARAGFEVVVKRLPPKGVNRLVSIDLEMAVDIVAFSYGQETFTDTSRYFPTDHLGENYRRPEEAPAKEEESASEETPPPTATVPEKRIVTVVCPSIELSYPLSLIRERDIDTVSADFGQFNPRDVLKSAAKWIDLSDSETIWRE